MKTLRVLQVVPNMHAAGLETLIMNLYRNIDRNKVQFDFLVHYEEPCFYDDEIEALGGKIYRLSFRNDHNILKYINNLNSFFKEHNYDIVHGHMASTACFYLGIAKKNGVPIRILHSHNTSTESTIKGFIKHQLLKFSTLFANEYFACGKLAGEYLYKNKPFTIIHNAIDLNKFTYDFNIRKTMKMKYNFENDFIIGHIGRFNTQKNHKFIIDVFEKVHSRIPNAKLILVGEGELEGEIKKIVINKNLNEFVKFMGIIKDTNAIYNMIDVFILPSLFEGLPVVGVECQATGCITLMSDTITKEIGLTNLVDFLPIESTEAINVWVNKIEGIYLKKDYSLRINTKNQLKDNGYDIIVESNNLMEKYKNLVLKREFK